MRIPSIETGIKVAIVAAIGLAAAGHFTDHGTPGIRKPVRAGSWYSDRPEVAAVELRTILSRANLPAKQEKLSAVTKENQDIGGPVLAIIAPHAAYRYSGVASARAYQAAAKRPIKRVFILGPLHFVSYRGAALTSFKRYPTPMGDLRVDTNAISELARQPSFQRDDSPQRSEHSIEMQLPMLRAALGDVQIVPIYVGRASSLQDVRNIATAIKRLLNKDDLVVASSDFTHWGEEYHYQPFSDNLEKNLAALDAEAFDCIKRKDPVALVDYKARTKNTVCGLLPCCVLLAMLPDNAHATLLDYYNSQDATRDDQGKVPQRESLRAVTYMPIAFSGTLWGSAK